MSPGCVGVQPTGRRQRARGGLIDGEEAAQPAEVPPAALRGMEVTGTPRFRPMISAMVRVGTPSSPTA